MASTQSRSLPLVYDYALRCSIRACLEQTSHLRPTSSRLPDRRSVHLGDMLDSLSDRFSEDTKTDKLTREVVRALVRRLEDIKNTPTEDPRFLLLSSQIQKSIQQHRYRPTGTIQDLVVVFIKMTEAELKKEITSDDLAPRYVARFADIIKVTVLEDAPSSATPELLDALDGFIGKTKGRRHLSMDRRISSSSLAFGSVESFEQFPMVKTVQVLFKVDPTAHRNKLRELQLICTQSAFMQDLKQCINKVHIAKPTDFPTQQSYDTWQKREIKQLSELLKTLSLLDPNLPTADTPAHSGFTFIPSDPYTYFRQLMTICIDHDTKNTPESERAKSSVLSQPSDDLLRECWRTWRLSSPYRTLLYLELVKQRFDKGVFDMNDLRHATRMLDRALKENDITNWRLSDRANLIRIYENMERTFIEDLANGLSEYWKASPDWIYDIVAILDRIYDDPLHQQTHSSRNPYQALVETVEGAAVERWRNLEESSMKQGDDDLTNLLTLADKLTKELVSLATKKFKTPIKGVLNIPGAVMSIQMPFFALEMENWAYLPSAQEAPIEVTFYLYHKILSLKRLYDQYGPQQKSVSFKVESWFLAHVKRWLKATDGATPEWVGNAIKQDDFKWTRSMHSSSIVDLFSLFHQAVDFIQKLQWPNEYQLCRFMTSLSKVISVSLNEYTLALEDMILQDIYPHLNHTTPGSHSFLNKAKLQLTGNRSSFRLDTIPDDFTPELCVKINNIEAARTRLDRLYQMMDADQVANYLRQDTLTVMETKETNYLYSIKAVRAENLQPKDSNGLSDPYVVFQIDGVQVGRTRTVYETLNPRWDQTFDLWLENGTISVLGVVYDENLLTSSDECGGVWFKLSPQYFDDYQSHDLVLDLHPQGQLVLRVTMEGEKDDIQFWFAKAFRTLKRAENDATGLVVDKMGRYIQYCLSRKTLDKLLGHDKSFFSFNRNSKQVEPDLQGCEDAIVPLLDYLERNLKILNDHLSESNMQRVLLKIWKELLVALENILLPPLSEHHSDMKPLDDYEFHVVYKWLELLKILFNGGADGDAIPIERLETSRYYALLAINVAYNLETEKLMEIYHVAAKNQAELQQRGGRKADRSKSVYQSRNTARKKAARKSAASIDLPSGEVVLRILRMRPGKHVREFLKVEFEKRNHPPPPPPPPHADNSLLDDHPLPPPPPVPSHHV